MKQEVAAGHVDRVKLYVDQDGRVVKRALYVSAAAIPEWVIDLADEKIGPGSNEYYELEWYADAPSLRVYEVTRTVKGAKVEVSVNENRELRYMEKELKSAAVPAKVRSAVAGLQGFRVEEYEEKVGPEIHEYQAEGSEGGRKMIYTFSPDGRLLRKEQSIEAELQVTAGS
jgi:hypothetical protein